MKYQVIVGTYTGSGSEGIYSYTIDSVTGEVSAAQDCAPICNPSYLEVSEDGKYIYAVTEVSDRRASLTAFAFEGGRFRRIGSRPSIGSDPCFVATNGLLVLTANYGGTLSVYPIKNDGSVGVPSLFYGSTGGPDTRRQATPHIHCAVFSPDGRYVFASDFSADRLIRYDLSEDGASLKESGLSFPTPGDTGPRHFVFDSSGRHLYLLGELSGAISVYECNDGLLNLRQTIKAARVESRGAGDIHLCPEGRHLYASCRLKDEGIAVFDIMDDGLLHASGYVCTGPHPRNFNITPDGRMMLVACRDSDCIEIYAINPLTGLPEDTSRRIPISKPVCIKFTL